MRKELGKRMLVVFGIIAVVGILYSIFYLIWFKKKYSGNLKVDRKD